MSASQSGGVFFLMFFVFFRGPSENNFEKLLRGKSHPIIFQKTTKSPQ